MKQIACVVALLLLAVACAEAKKTTIVGHVKSYGSVPMTYVGFITTAGEAYSLVLAPKAAFTLKTLGALQGKMLRLTGVVSNETPPDFQTLADGRFVVYRYQILH